MSTCYTVAQVVTTSATIPDPGLFFERERESWPVNALHGGDGRPPLQAAEEEEEERCRVEVAALQTQAGAWWFAVLFLAREGRVKFIHSLNWLAQSS